MHSKAFKSMSDFPFKELAEGEASGFVNVFLHMTSQPVWQLRPWSLLEIVDGCFLIYRRLFPLLFGLAATILTPYYLVVLLVQSLGGMFQGILSFVLAF